MITREDKEILKSFQKKINGNIETDMSGLLDALIAKYDLGTAMMKLDELLQSMDADNRECEIRIDEK